MPAPLFPRLLPRLGLALPFWLLFTLAAPAALATVHYAPGEYFFNDDPGLGQATPLPFASPTTSLADLDEMTNLVLPLPASPGAGLTLGLRFRDTNGNWGNWDSWDNWGPTVLRRFFLLRLPAPDVVQWTWGTPFPTDDSQTGTIADGAITLPRPAVGAPEAASSVLQLRPWTDGLPGRSDSRTNAPLATKSPSKLLYALDHSPNPATASFIELGATHLTAPTSAVLDLGSPAPGFHSLHLQVRDAHGARTETVRFLHVTQASVQTLAGLAYVFRRPTSPDSGEETSVEVLPLTASGAPQDIAMPVPGSLSAGDYTLLLSLATGAGDLLFTTPSPTLELRTSDLAAYETWTAAQGLVGEAASMLADPDADGFVNLLEYAMGTAPGTAEKPLPYQTWFSSDLNGRFIIMEYRQRSGGTGTTGRDYTAGGLRYSVEASTDLKQWLPYHQVSGLSAHVTRRQRNDGTESVAMEIFPAPALASAGRLFVRLNVSVAP